MSSFKNPKFLLFGLFVWLVAYVFVFHEMILSGFQQLPGDCMDSLLILRIQEHWYEVFSGKSNWRNLGFFYPMENTLGLSDSFFLFGISHSLFRALGFGLFQAYAVNLTIISFVGFWGMFLFLRRGLILNPGGSLFFAFLFIVCHTVVSPGLANHMQFLSIWYCPWFLYFSGEFLGSKDDGSRKYGWGVLSAASLALLFFNAYYFAWFTVFFGGIVLVIACLLRLIENHSFIRSFSWFTPKMAFVIWGAVFLLFLIPFLLTYWAPFCEFGPREFNYIDSLLPSRLDILHVSETNFFWGEWVRVLYPLTEMESERSYGFTPFLLLSFLLSAAVVFNPNFRTESKLPMRSLVLAMIVVFGLVFKIGEFSLWKFVYQFVPGATAIRVPYRFNAFLILPALIVISTVSKHYLDADSKARKTALFLGSLLMLLVVAEQWTLSPDHPWRLDSASIEKELAAIPEIPEDAIAFYIKAGSHCTKKFNYLAEFKAMMVSQEFDIPTINGYSGLFPNKYPFRAILRGEETSEYNKAMLQWLIDKDIYEGIYALDYQGLKWERIGNLFESFSDVYEGQTKYAIGDTIAFGSDEMEQDVFSGNDSIISGFSDFESDKTWTIGKISKSVIFLEDMTSDSLVLRIKGRALLSDEHPCQHFRVSVNGKSVGEISSKLEDCGKWYSFAITEKQHRMLVITIESLDSIAPSEISESKDERVLGFAVEKMKLDYI